MAVCAVCTMKAEISSRYPWATTDPLGPDHEGTLTSEADLSLAQAARVRSELIRPRSDCRTDIYGITVSLQPLQRLLLQIIRPSGSIPTERLGLAVRDWVGQTCH
jgi:hypothetical protein